MNIFKELKTIFSDTEKSLSKKSFQQSITIINGEVVSNNISDLDSNVEFSELEKEIDVNNIKKLINKVGNIKLNINENIEKESIILSCASSDVNKFQFIQNNDELKIKAEGNLRKFKITLNCKSLKEIENNFGDIEGIIYQTEDLYLKNNGVGNIKISGVINNINIKNSGVGNINLEDLRTEEAKVINSGTGNIDLITNYLSEVDCSGIGNVNCESVTVGNIRISGLGNFVQKKNKKNKLR
jgi:hypothetical protein